MRCQYDMTLTNERPVLTHLYDPGLAVCDPLPGLPGLHTPHTLLAAESAPAQSALPLLTGPPLARLKSA